MLTLLLLRPMTLMGLDDHVACVIWGWRCRWARLAALSLAIVLERAAGQRGGHYRF